MIIYKQVLPGEEERIAQLRQLFCEYQRDLDLDLSFQDFEKEIDSLPGAYGPPGGCALIAYSYDRPIACGALRDIGSRAAELKRIYVNPSHRGEGIGKAISIRLINVARDLGYCAVRLDTLERLTTAVSLYEKIGFKPIPPYNKAPAPGIRYFELNLSS